MGATRLGGAGDQTVGEWEGPSAPGGARGGRANFGVSIHPLGMLAGARLQHSFRGRGVRTLAGLW